MMTILKYFLLILASSLLAVHARMKLDIGEINLAMNRKLGESKVNAVFIAGGSTGDALPLLKFAKSLKAKYPWLNIMRFAAYPATNIKDRIVSAGFNFVPLVSESILSRQSSNDFFRRLVSNSPAEYGDKRLENPPEDYGLMLRYFDALDSSLYSIIDGASIVFHWLASESERTFLLMGERMKTNGNFWIELTPTMNLNQENLESNNELFTPKQALEWQENKQNHAIDMWEMNVIPSISLVSKAFVPTETHELAFFVGSLSADPDSDWAASAELRGYLSYFRNDGRPIIYIGFGSMSPGVAKTTNQMICSVIKHLSRIGFIWNIGSASKTPMGVLKNDKCLKYAHILSEFVPHENLFPHVSAVVHHGGAGTTQAAAIHGKPSIIIPQFMSIDQPYFAKYVTAKNIGLGLDKHAGRGDLIAAINRVTTDRDMLSNVKSLSRLMKAESKGNLGEKLVGNYIAANYHLLSFEEHLAPRFKTDKPCMKFGQAFYLRTETGYCRMVEEEDRMEIVCDMAAKGWASIFKFKDPAHAHVKIPLDIPLNARGFLTFNNGGCKDKLAVALKSRELKQRESKYLKSKYPSFNDYELEGFTNFVRMWTFMPGRSFDICPRSGSSITLDITAPLRDVMKETSGVRVYQIYEARDPPICKQQ
eukprot:Partr_v1_DN26784_c3_g1_i2_m8511 putative UDP-Glycosyltransferase